MELNNKRIIIFCIVLTSILYILFPSVSIASSEGIYFDYERQYPVLTETEQQSGSNNGSSNSGSSWWDRFWETISGWGSFLGEAFGSLLERLMNSYGNAPDWLKNMGLGGQLVALFWDDIARMSESIASWWQDSWFKEMYDKLSSSWNNAPTWLKFMGGHGLIAALFWDDITNWWNSLSDNQQGLLIGILYGVIIAAITIGVILLVFSGVGILVLAAIAAVIIAGYALYGFLTGAENFNHKGAIFIGLVIIFIPILIAAPGLFAAASAWAGRTAVVRTLSSIWGKVVASSFGQAIAGAWGMLKSTRIGAWVIGKLTAKSLSNFSVGAGASLAINAYKTMVLGHQMSLGEILLDAVITGLTAAIFAPLTLSIKTATTFGQGAAILNKAGLIGAVGYTSFTFITTGSFSWSTPIEGYLGAAVAFSVGVGLSYIVSSLFGNVVSEVVQSTAFAGTSKMVTIGVEKIKVKFHEFKINFSLKLYELSIRFENFKENFKKYYLSNWMRKF